MFTASISSYFSPEKIKSTSTSVASAVAKKKSQTTTDKKLAATKGPYTKKERGVRPKKESLDDKSVIEIDNNSNEESDPKKPELESSLKVAQL